MINRYGSENLLETVRQKLASADSFSSLTASCDGAFPARIADALTYLSPSVPEACELLAKADRPPLHRPFSDRRLPLPHPLDFEWRFAHESIDEILHKLNSIAKPQEKLLFVCTPAVALRAFDAKNPRQLVYASRMNDPVTNSLKDICGGGMEFIEVTEDLSYVGAAAAVVDPPWYDDIALPLVTRALSGLAEGGGLLICIPDKLSGCSSAIMLSSILMDARPFGMECAQPIAGKLRYETPFFELNTLRQQGLCAVHPQWRTGRAALGRKTSNCIPQHAFPVEKTWSEIGGGGWRTRLRAPGATRLTASNLIRFDIRRSISRPAMMADEEECWTVGNRVGYALHAEHIPENEHCAQITSSLREIAQVELNEISKAVTNREKSPKAMENKRIMVPSRERPIYSARIIH